MSKKRVKKETVNKANFDLSKFKKNNGMNTTTKEKELSWIPLSESFYDALKLPGIPRGYFTSFRGFSNTGKSTAIYEAVAGAQKIGDLPIIIDTETNWNWEHARNIGVEFKEIVDENTGEIIDYEGDFLFFQSKDLLDRYSTYDYNSSKETSKPLRGEPVIEDVAMLMTELLDAQMEGNLPRNLLFLWDSVGSINGFKSATAKASNNQWNAGSMEAAFKAITNFRIPSSRREDSEYTNTFAVVQKIWLDNENKVIKHKGGEAFFYSPRIIIHYGGILSHSTKLLKATSGGEDYQFGVETRISCVKNQVNGVEEKGKIASTPHGYWNPTKLEEYKKIHKDYILGRLNTPLDDFNIVIEEGKFSDDDLKA